MFLRSLIVKYYRSLENVRRMVISRSAEGKFVESWEVYDTLGMMRQLGLVIIPGPRLLVGMLVGQAKKLGARLPKGR